MRSGIVICCLSFSIATSTIQTASAQISGAARTTIGERVGLNFIRPDVGRPGNYDFENNGVWLAGQLSEIGVQWTRMAFSWVLVQPTKDEFNWSAYDRIVDACTAKHIQVLATLGGHFDRPPVPAWAGKTLADVVANHPEYLERFIQAWVSRYKDRIHYWEILNEPSGQHFDLTLRAYVEKILKPSYRLIKAADPQAKVLPCAYGNLPDAHSNAEDPRGSEAFWDLARGYYDIGNYHEYAEWNIFRTLPVADMEERDLSKFKALMAKHGEGEKPFWVTEIGWWGTGSLSNKYDVYRQDPETGMTFKPVYTGKEIMENTVVRREDELRTEWIKDLVTRVASIPDCQKIFLWASMDEFEGGFQPDTKYGEHAAEADLWGFIAGDKTWRKSAFTLQNILKQ